MSSLRSRQLGAALLAVGVLALLARAGLFGLLPAFVWVVLLFVAGAALLSQERLPFPARLLAFIGIGIVATATSGAFGGTAATGFVAMAFALTYLRRPQQGWALIPAGVMASVCLVTTAETLFPRWDAAPLFLLGMAATFTLLYVLPKGRGGQRWALYPAVVWILLTVLANDPSGHRPGWLLPLLLIGGGAALLWWWRRGD